MAGTLTLEELEKHAEDFLSNEAFLYYANGTGNGITLRENRVAFSRFVVHFQYAICTVTATMKLQCVNANHNCKLGG